MLLLLGVQAQTEREKKLAARHIRSASTSPPLYPTVHSPLPPFFLSSFLPFLLLPLASPPRCVPYPLYFHPSASTYPQFSFFFPGS